MEPGDLDDMGAVAGPLGDPDADTGEIVGGPGTEEAPPWSDDDHWDLEAPDGPGSSAKPWEDTRTSVFDPPPEPGPAGGETRSEELHRFSASDTEPSGGRRGSPRHDHDRRPAVADHHLVIGCVAAAVVLFVSGFILLSEIDNADDADLPMANGAISTTTEAGIATTAAPPTTGPSVETGDQPADDGSAETTASDHSSDGSTTPSSAPPASAGDTTTPPAEPSTTSTESTSTSTPASNTSSTTLPPDDGRNEDGGGLLELLDPG
jgi:hypothetical protein